MRRQFDERETLNRAAEAGVDVERLRAHIAQQHSRGILRCVGDGQWLIVPWNERPKEHCDWTC